jgi:hypothetical protein
MYTNLKMLRIGQVGDHRHGGQREMLGAVVRMAIFMLWRIFQELFQGTLRHIGHRKSIINVPQLPNDHAAPVYHVETTRFDTPRTRD